MLRLSHSYITKVRCFLSTKGYEFSSVDHEANRYNFRIVKSLEIKGKEQRLMDLSDKGITQKFVIIAFY